LYPDEHEIPAALDAARARVDGFLRTVRDRPPAAPFQPDQGIELEEMGVGAAAAIDALWRRFGGHFSGSTGPRYWGYVHGGVTPAALAADWLCSAVDQTGQMHGDSPAVAIEAETIAMLRDLFGLPDAFHGMFVSGGSMANYAGLAIGLQRLGLARGIDVSRDGVTALPPVRILTGECHASTARAAGMLGLGRSAVERLPLEPGRERLSIAALRRRLEEVSGDPVIIVGNAGTVTTGDFDDFGALADLAGEHGAHLHADGAFGLFARLAPGLEALGRGIERADTIASDAHKWLNVPYDSGLLFSRHLDAQTGMFKNESSYLPPPATDPLNFPNLGPENSRRLRALPAWASLQAYGRAGHREMVERSVALAGKLAELLDADPGFRLLAPARLNIVCFVPLEGGNPFAAAAIRRFVALLVADGRVRVSSSVFDGRPCIRLAILNWRTTEADLDLAMAAFRACRDRAISDAEGDQ
jgi:glutamate/tyrosine decarboxylase-like PLP-dependent enzyme